MTELHSIGGWFYEGDSCEYWKEYFIRETEDDSNLIKGIISDIYGASRIDGTMNLNLFNLWRCPEFQNKTEN